MSKTYTTLSRESINYLCSVIKHTASLSDNIVDDLHLLSNGTFSSVKINTLLNTLKSDCTQYTDTLVANLARLELKLVTNESDISQPNIMYLYKPDGATSYNQYVVIDGTKVLLGTCDVEMSDYLKVSDAANKYTLKTDYDTLVNEVTDIKDKINTHTDDTDIHTSADEKASYALKADITDTIDSTSTSDKMASAKAVFHAIHEHILMTLSSASDITALLTKLRSLAPGTNATIKLYDNSGVLFPVTGNYIGTVSVINGNEITVICVNHWYSQHAYTFKVQNDDTSISLNKICTTKVADVPKTDLIFTCAAGGTFTSDEDCSYFVQNGVCYVSLLGLKVNGYTYGNVITTNLPIPKLKINPSLTDNSGVTIYGKLYIDSNGNCWFHGVPTDFISYNTFSYPVEES